MTSNSPETPTHATVHLPPAVETPRRSMLVHLTTAALSFLIIAVPSTLSGLFFLDPILRKRKAASGSEKDGEVPRKDEAGFIRLDVTKDAVPEDGTPLSVTVIDDLIDAWNMFRDVPVGSVWLRKVGDGPIIAFNSVCPHLGCSVDYIRAENHFFCPCHTSAFSLDGKKTNEIPPRDMDALEVSMRTNGQDDPRGLEIWVKFQNFQKTKSDKIVI